jgi:hypothetical protein
MRKCKFEPGVVKIEFSQMEVYTQTTGKQQEKML